MKQYYVKIEITLIFSFFAFQSFSLNKISAMFRSSSKIFFILLALFITSCQPDGTDDPTPNTGDYNFTGTWNRDTVIVNDVAPNGLRSRVETEINFGKYTFNSDKQTGVLNLSGTDFGITWNYNATGNYIKISEIDWVDQIYSIQKISSTKFILTGLKDVGGGFQNERIIYLTKD